MTRRTTIKGLIAFGLVGTSLFSVSKWLNLNKAIDISELLKHKNLISELAEVIIPRTDTPGAKDARVEEYIIKMIINCSETKAQNNFINGLNYIQSFSLEKFDKKFEKCNIEQKVEILKHFENDKLSQDSIFVKVGRKILGKPFFSELKELTVIGYSTSMIGSTQGLAYDYIPGNYISCIKLNSHQKSWATK